MLMYANMYPEKECRDGKENSLNFSKIEDNCNSPSTKNMKDYSSRGITEKIRHS